MRVTTPAEKAVRQGHPWLFDHSITSLSHVGAPGDIAVVFDRKGRFLAVGLYDPESPLRVRLLHHGRPRQIDQAWYTERFGAAAKIRDALPGDTTGFRLVHGENDSLPGFVLDKYEGTLVLKLYSAAWIPHLRSVLPTIVDRWSPERIVLRLSRLVQRQERNLHGLSDGCIVHGAELTRPVTFRENGLRFECDPMVGQKTGFFLDQRDNRSRVQSLAENCEVLDVFSYTGGFALYAASGGATRVTTVDLSSAAAGVVARNFALNKDHPQVKAASTRSLIEDAFEALERLRKKGHRYDMVVIDPPAFAKNRAEASRALGAYSRLTGLGIRVLNPGGILVQASCSSWVDDNEFYATVLRGARLAHGRLQEIERTGHPIDHPVGFDEGAYLKCLFARSVKR